MTSRNGSKPTRPERPIPKPYDAVDLLARNLPPTIFAVHGLLPEGVTIFGGRPKQGQSWRARRIAQQEGA